MTTMRALCASLGSKYTKKTKQNKKETYFSFLFTYLLFVPVVIISCLQRIAVSL
jgi:hypothetical protein